MYRNLVTFVDYFNSNFRDLLSKKSLNLWHKVSKFSHCAKCSTKQKGCRDLFFLGFTRVQMVGPCGDGLPCLSMDVDQRLLCGFCNLLWRSGGKTYNLGTPDDGSEISPSQRKHMTAYTRYRDSSLYSCWVIYIDRMRVIYKWWTSRTLKSPCNQSQPFLSLPATNGK
jgi:hypothetical protein